MRPQQIHRHMLSKNMKNHYRTVMVLLCLVFTVIACIPQPSGPTEEEYQGTIDFSKYEESYDELPGTWDWIRTTRFETIDGIPATETPSSSGIRKILLITEDQQIEIIQDDTLSTTEPLESFLQGNNWGIRGDTLATKSTAYNGPESVYLRIE